MAIQTQASFSGFVVSDPQLSYTENGDARLFVKVGKEHFRHEKDGSFTQLETTFHNLVAFRAAAEEGHARLAKGDRFVAEGYVREYPTKDAEGRAIQGEEFVARRLGHDLARTRYEVDRFPRRGGAEREAPAFEPLERRRPAPTRTPTLSA
ncbi:single-stranded DNA-binding protein [Microbacterium lacticum]|uniref:single-stranded DNA-binding protein n=1 Tax=Microbacterium lacticum TaxID=33885 RepID=UPI003A8C0103